ncbi:MAG: hypothetical protein ACRES9_04285 [Gammaproteobacteria bacterium]
MSAQPESMALREAGRDDIPAEELYGDPHWLVYCLDPELRRAYFLRLTREMYHRSCFLDPRMANENPTLHSIAMTELEALHAAAPRKPARRFIFHTAFCCSSLLARSLDFPGRTLAIREPTILVQIANAARRPGNAQSRWVTNALPLTLGLLNKPFGTEKVFIKPTNVATNCLGAMLDGDPHAHGLVLWGGREDFLISALKRPRQSNVQMPIILERLLADPMGRNWQGQGHPEPHTLAEQAALAWHLEMLQINHWLKSPHAKRLRVLATDELLARPVESIAATARHLDIAVETEKIRAMVNGPVWHRHAKTTENYSPEKRAEEKRLARRLFGHEIAAGLRYAQTLRPVLEEIPSELALLAA